MNALFFCLRSSSGRPKNAITLAGVVLVFSFCFSICHGQVNLTGNVRTENDEPLPFATIALLFPEDSTMVAGTITDETGTFVLAVPAGSYLINTSMVGF
jgi:hypothetical protein